MHARRVGRRQLDVTGTLAIYYVVRLTSYGHWHHEVVLPIAFTLISV
jgi:hypothetical protein